MRRLLVVLDDDQARALEPQPSLDHVDALVAEVRAAGLPVSLRIEGVANNLPAGVDLCAYRLVQEALTNTLKHAGPATASVLLRYASDAVEIEVADTGPGIRNGTGGGRGLTGMRERVAVLGGDLRTGPQQAGGFVVAARLPL
jgi:signal transduction histidine kinase